MMKLVHNYSFELINAFAKVGENGTVKAVINANSELAGNVVISNN